MKKTLAIYPVASRLEQPSEPNRLPRKWQTLPWGRCVAILAILIRGIAASAADEQHFLLVSTREGRDILRYNRDTGAFVDTFVSAGSGGLGVPYGMDIGSDGNLYVASTMTEAAYDSRILKYDIRTGAFLGVFANFHPDMSGPLGISFGPGGDLYVADRSTDPATPGQVLRFNGATGAYLGDFTHGTPTLSIPTGITFGPNNVLYVPNLWGGVARFDGTTGNSLGIMPTPGMSSTQFVQFGPDGFLYVTDYFSQRISAFDVATGEVKKTLNGGTSGMKFDSDGSLFVADFWANQILKFSGDVPSIFALGNPLGTPVDSLHPLNGPLDILLYDAVPEPTAGPILVLVGAGVLLVVRHRSSRRHRSLPDGDHRFSIHC